MGIRRGEIYYVYLDPVFGREMGGYKTRPVCVLSINDINNKPLVVTVVPGTSAKGRIDGYKNSVHVQPSTVNGLTDVTIFECHQLRSLDQGRFTSRPIGRLTAEELTLIEKAVGYRLGLPLGYPT